MKKFTLVLVVTLFMSACGGGGGGITPPPPKSDIVVSVSPASQTSIDQGQPVNFTASLTNDTTNAGVAWSASGAGCTGNACGTFTNVTTTAATYNAPALVTNGSSVTVTATSVADNTKSAASTVVLTPPPHITTQVLPNAIPADYYPARSYSATLNASGGVGALTWTLLSGSLPAGLTFTSTGIISGIPTSTSTAATTSNFTVQVADQSQAVSGPYSTQQAFSITVAGVLTITTTTAALPIGTVGSAYSVPIESVGGTLPITWSVVSTSGSLPYGLALQGTSNTSSSQISGTPTVANNFQFQIQAIDSSTPPQTTPPLTLVISVISSPLAITTRSLPNGTANTPYTAQLVATGGTPPYSWSYSWGTPSPVSWMTALASGVLSGISPAGQWSFGVTVTDAAFATASQPLTLNINPAATACNDSGSESLLDGQYAFSLSGYNAPASFLTVVGSFTADGKGNITGGEADTNGALGAQASPSLSGSYSVGSSNLGCATLTTSFGTFVTRFALGSLSANIATQGRIIEWDSPNSSAYIAAGQILRQSTSSFVLGLNGSYVFQTAGWDESQTGGRIACIGYVDASKFIDSGAEQDCNDAGTMSDPVPGATPLPGTYSSFDVNGRGTAIASVVSSTGTTTFHFTLYMVNNSQLLVVTSDPFQALGGEMLSQNVPLGSSGFAQASLDGNAVFYLTGASGGGSESAVSLDLAVADGVSNLAFTSYADYQGTWLGNGTPPLPQFTCPYSVESSGRVTVTCPANNPNGYTSLYLYLTDLNTGFLVDTLPGVDTGALAPQTVPAGGVSALTGSFFSSPAEALNQEIGSNSVNEISLSAGSVTGTSDSTSTSDQTADYTFTDTYTNLPANGTFMAQSSSNTFVGIILNSHKFVMLDPSSITTPNPILLLVQQ
jgi:hypothetical protein